MKFTPSQQEAIEIINTNCIVSAGAGSGKTAVLTEKVYYLIKEKKYHIDEMLILTFTKLAAGEMKHRIKNKLKDEFKEESLNVDSAYITNFDSFALSLVKKYHLLLGLNEDISIVTSTLDVKRNLWIEEEVKKQYDENNPDFLNLLKRVTLKDDEEVKKLIFNFLKKSELASSIDDYFKKISYEEYMKILDLALEQVLTLFKDKQDALYSILEEFEEEKSKEKMYKWLEGYLNSSTYDDFVSSVVLLNRFPSFKPECVDYELTRKIKSINDNFFKEIKDSLKYEEFLKKNWAEEYALKEKVKEIAYNVYKRMYNYKVEHQVFEFYDIALFAYNLVKDNEEIRNKLKNQFKIIMVDEYQDTSYSQERFLNLICDNNMFMVGDIKQSIYRFRHARPEIFNEKYLNYQKGIGGKKIDLNENFRSRKEVLNDINTIFSSIMSLEKGNANYKKDHIILPGNKLYDTVDIPKKETMAITYSLDEEVSEKNEYEANLIADDILRRIKNNEEVTVFKNGIALKTKVSFSSFCILMDRGTSFNTYQRIFKERGIPLFVENNEKINAHAIVFIVKNFFKMFSKIRNAEFDNEFKHSFLSLSRSFLYAYDDNEILNYIRTNNFQSSTVYKDIKYVLDNVKSKSLYETLKLYIEKSNFYYRLISNANIDNNIYVLENFYDYIKEMDLLDYTIEELIEFFDSSKAFDVEITLSSSSTDEDAVKMMNIHKSKGLEFPIVYYPGLTKKENKSEEKKSSIISDKFGILLSDEEGDKGLMRYLLKQEENADNLSERIRIFYVGLTRAKEQMIFVYPSDDKEKTMDSASCFYDFLKASNLNLKEYFRTIEYLKNEDEISNEHELDLDYQEIKFEEKTEKEINKKSSKNISLDSSLSALNYGTKIHFIMNYIDFNNPDFSKLNNYEKEVVQKFFNSELFLKIKDGTIYKEYQFEEDNVIGIIDLFSIFEDKIMLVDYKLKNLDDEEYNKQIKIYASYLNHVFNKEVEAYLYSLIDGTFIEII